MRYPRVALRYTYIWRERPSGSPNKQQQTSCTATFIGHRHFSTVQYSIATTSYIREARGVKLKLPALSNRSTPWGGGQAYGAFRQVCTLHTTRWHLALAGPGAPRGKHFTIREHRANTSPRSEFRLRASTDGITVYRVRHSTVAYVRPRRGQDSVLHTFFTVPGTRGRRSKLTG